MKILFCIRDDYLINIAGDSIQLLKTIQFMREMGVEVDINNEKTNDYSVFDIVHLFNLTRISETYRHYKNIQKCGMPVVITPIYWNLEHFYSAMNSLDTVSLWNDYFRYRSEILSGCQMIFPSSEMEMTMLKGEYGADLPCTVIYNGVDIKELKVLQEADQKEAEEDPFILCVGRICPRKNQLALADAAYRLGLRLVLAGDANNKEYLNKCLKYKNVRYIGFCKPNQLVELYKNASLHALCSYVETPGLASLEAGACGCNIISTSQGSTKEYFGDMALYCDPYDESSIYSSLEAGMSFNMQPRLQEHILGRYNLENCLKDLYQSYLGLLR